MVDDVMAQPGSHPTGGDEGPEPGRDGAPARIDTPAAVATDTGPTTPVGPVRLPWPAALIAAAAAGALLLVAFPPVNLWWTAPLGVAGLAVATRGRGAWAGAGLGLLTGAVFFTPLLDWTGLHVGALPWLLLSALEAAYLALLGAAGALTGRLVRRWRWSWPLLTALGWVGQEALRDRTPFGGFPWGRLAFSQADSPLLHLAVLGGAPLVTFAVALLGGLLAAAGWQLWQRGARTGTVWATVGLVLAAVLLAQALPAATPGGRTVTVAIVQGNVPRLGLDFNAQREAVLEDHVNATLQLARRVDAGTVARPDLVIWPENASDVDPLANPDAKSMITRTARAVGSPILVGGLINGADGHPRNVGIVWRPDAGPTQIYIKRHPVPFAEYIPLRGLASRISDKVNLVRSDFVAGHKPGVLRIGPAVIGDVICFEVAYDNLVRDTVTGGGQLLVVQTNNATFNPAEAEQQLAMVRLRAVEHGRAALMASTVGVSGFVDSTGAVHDATAFNTAAVAVRQVTLSSARTIATRLGSTPELVMAALALIGVVASVMMGSGAADPEAAAPAEERRQAGEVT